MANFDTIKTAIDANIKTNGTQDITGGKMNSILKQMVDATDEQLTELESKEILVYSCSSLPTFEANSITFNSSLYIRFADGSLTWDLSTLKYTFTENGYLVVRKSNLTKATIKKGADLKDDDIILLYYTSGNFVGGLLYSQYIESTKAKIIGIHSRNASINGSVLTIQSIIVISRDESTKTIYASTDQTPKSYAFDGNCRFLVLTQDGKIEAKIVSSEIKSSDEILLHYDVELSDFVGGWLYPIAQNSQLESREIRVFSCFTNPSFTNNSITFNNSLYIRFVNGSQTWGLSTKKYEFTETGYLVINKNNLLQATIKKGADLKDDDIILLYYTSGNFVGGLLYQYYLAPRNEIKSIYTRDIKFNDNNVSLTSLFIIKPNGGPSEILYAADDQSEVTYSFGGACRYLVINQGKIYTRSNSSAVDFNDVILLVFDTTLNTFVDGMLMPLYISATSQKNKDKRDVPDNLGVYNAIRKAHQMTDILWTAVAPLDYNSGSFSVGSQYRGVIYSSVKEMNQFVNEDISMHTYMTALHNPRSIIYRVKADESPLHGQNCRAYYGTVCSGLVGYAYGVKTNMRTYDFVVADFMEKVKGQDVYNLKLGDFLWRPGHTAMITDIYRDEMGNPTKVEISEAANATCQRYYLTGSQMQELIKSTEWDRWEIYRNKNLADNIEYTPLTNFVAVDGETLSPFIYNDDIMSWKGDKSLYISGEEVKILIVEDYAEKGWGSVELYKNDVRINVQSVSSSEMAFSNLEYGSYKARLVKDDGTVSEFTYWKVIDVNVSVDRDNNRVLFASANSTPIAFEFCNIAGFRSEEYKEETIIELSEVDVEKGYIEVTPPSQIPDSAGRTYTYVKVHFQDEYGRVINAPIEWYSVA